MAAADQRADGHRPAGEPGFGITTVNPRHVLATGGVPVVRDGVVVGGIGLSGGLPEQDEGAALAGVAAVR